MVAADPGENELCWRFDNLVGARLNVLLGRGLHDDSEGATDADVKRRLGGDDIAGAHPIAKALTSRPRLIHNFARRGHSAPYPDGLTLIWHSDLFVPLPLIRRNSPGRRGGLPRTDDTVPATHSLGATRAGGDGKPAPCRLSCVLLARHAPTPS